MPRTANYNIMLEKLLLPDIRELLQARDFATLSEHLNDWHPADLAALIADLAPDEQPLLLGALNPPLQADTFEHLDLDTQEHLLNVLPEEQSAEILNLMAPDDRTALLEELPEELAQRLLALLSPEERAVAQALLEYSEDSVGRLMTPDYVAVRHDWTIKRVLDHIRTHGKDSETLNVVYVTDEQGKLMDDLRIRELLLAPLHRRVSDIMDEQFVSLNATDDRRTAVEVFKKYDRSALPVIDPRGMLVGIVTIDDVIDVAEEEATRELQRFGGMEALDEPYTSTPMLAMVRKRAVWLTVLFLGQMLTATAMEFYEDQIVKAVFLASFVPLIISSGGNSGSQAATVIIRALALGEVRLRDALWVLKREIASGFVLGCILGLIGFLRIAGWSTVSDAYGGPHWPLVGITIAVTLVGVVLWGTIAGAMLPFALKRLGFDPAVSSAPFVSTLVDVTGLIIYFGTATAILSETLLK